MKRAIIGALLTGLALSITSPAQAEFRRWKAMGDMWLEVVRSEITVEGDYRVEAVDKYNNRYHIRLHGDSIYSTCWTPETDTPPLNVANDDYGRGTYYYDLTNDLFVVGCGNRTYFIRY